MADHSQEPAGRNRNLTRRDFLVESGLTAAGVAGMARLTAAQTSRASGANERVRLGLIGCGPRGSANLRLMLEAGADCVALADPDDTRTAGVIERAKSEGFTIRPETYRDYRKVLDHPDVDAVLVSTPDHWHAICAIHAAQAGKDVFVEKPISHNIREGRRMVQAAHKHNRVMMVGTQQRSGDHFISGKAFMATGQLGRVCLVKAWVTCHNDDLPVIEGEQPPKHVDYDLWLGPAPKRPFDPNRFHYQWRWFWDYAGGKHADWGIHLIDIVHWYMNVNAPLAASSAGDVWIIRDNRDTPDTQSVIFEYPTFTCTWEHRQGNARGIEDRSHGIAFYGENGTLIITRGEWRFFPEGRPDIEPVVFAGSGERPMFERHAAQFLSCVKDRSSSNADIEQGHRSTSACQLGNIAFRARRRIQWDPMEEEIVNDPEASQMLTREYREPYVLPEV